ncbi:unannotated protein [freshwater metagenome]|uniref:Unannotated protein n=1 Tax=freshwater metagenome TaxID=449393 RepID=A0A6J7A656_9ZZZZ
MHWQTEYGSCKCLRHFNSPVADRESLIRSLLVKRSRVVHRRWHTIGLKSGNHARPVINLNGVLSPSRASSDRGSRHNHSSSEPIRIAICNCLAGLDLITKHRQFLQQDGRLDRIEPTVYTDANVVVFLGPRTVDSDGLEYLDVGRVCCNDCPSVPVATQGLCREERSGRHRSHRANRGTVSRSAKTLCGIGNHPHPERSNYLIDRRVIRW